MRRAATFLLLAAYVATIYGANWAVARFDMVPVGLGLVAPAGVYVAGLALLLRDFAQQLGGRTPVAVAIVVGCVVSWNVDPKYAVASAVAFGTAGLSCLLVFSVAQKRGILAAIVAANVVGDLVDSVAYLSIAFGSLHYLPGQLVGKLWLSLPFAIALGVRRAHRARVAA